jgi:type I restriction enzyme M protein
MALKKSDLYGSLWAGADELRGGMDAGQYKDYVLTLLFVKYVSDKAKAEPERLIEVPAGGSFDDLVALKGRPDIGERVNIAIRLLAEANNQLLGVINNADFDDSSKLGEGKALVDRLTRLIGIFEDLDFSGSRAEGDDLLGDAYEYLMRHFATESGKSKGQFYTPAEVSRVMAQLIGIRPDTPRSATVYDPTCGSGSLLIKVADAAPQGLTIYGQEKDNTTRALAVMNMILHGHETATIRQGDTLADPKLLKDGRLQTFDFLVANPPFSVKSWTSGLENEYGRFDGYGRPPEKNGDYAFLLHMVKSLNPTGKGAVVLPHGVLFRGNAEAVIRRELVRKGYIKGVVGLPANLFYGTGIPACLILLDKETAATRTGIFMVDASRGLIKDGNKNRLRPRDMHQIVDACRNEKDIPGYARMVPIEEIAGNDHNLNIARYIDSAEPEDIQDLQAHVRGGIPDRDLDALHLYWEAFGSLRAGLFKPLRDGYSEIAVERADVRGVITGSPEYQKFAADVAAAAADWWRGHAERLRGISSSTRPGDLADELGETLLERFRAMPLVDEYGAYERFMSYWQDVMHDDVTMLLSAWTEADRRDPGGTGLSGWTEAVRPRPARVVGTTSAGKPRYEDADLVFGSGVKAERWVMDLIAPELIVARYFPAEAAELERLEAAVEVAASAAEEYLQEHAVEEGLLGDAGDDDGKVTAKTAGDRLKAARLENADRDEIDALTRVLALFRAEAAARKAAREAALALDRATLGRYAELTDEDVRVLLIEDKWGAHLMHGLREELDVLIRRLLDRVTVLTARYAEPLSALDAEVAALSAKVAEHLARLGVTA